MKKMERNIGNWGESDRNRKEEITIKENWKEDKMVFFWGGGVHKFSESKHSLRSLGAKI
jgi:hypothetical protein